MPDVQLELLTAFSRVQVFANGEIIFFEKDPADHVYVIIEGSAELVISADGGRSRHLSFQSVSALHDGKSSRSLAINFPKRSLKQIPNALSQLRPGVAPASQAQHDAN